MLYTTAAFTLLSNRKSNNKNRQKPGTVVLVTDNLEIFDLTDRNYNDINKKH